MKLKKDIEELTRQLEQAISAEEYEKAAVIRDEIKRVKEQLELKDRGESND